MTRTWYLDTDFERVRVAPRGEVVRAVLEPAVIEKWLRDPAALSTLLSVANALAPSLEAPRGPDDVDGLRRVRDVLLSAVATGALLVQSQGSTFGALARVTKTTGISAPIAPKTIPTDEPTTWFSLTVVDEQGMPLDDLALELTIDGKARKVKTNGAGQARVDDAHMSFGSARFANLKSVRDKLRERKIPNADAPAPKGENVRVVPLTNDLASIPLEAEKPLTVVLRRNHVRIRLIGMHFETDKAFLLPSAMRGVRRVVEAYKQLPDGKLLSVGHTDTAGEEHWNLDLSLERADAMADYLTDRVDGWLKWFDVKVHPKKFWGVREEQHMLRALPEGAEPFYAGTIDGIEGTQTHEAAARFQAWSNTTRGTSLVVDGKIGPATRRELVTAYMALDATSLPKGMTIERHGCGEFFPEDATEDGVADPENRRVEVFCFDGAIEPPPPGKLSKRGSTEYPTWRKQATETIDFETTGVSAEGHIVRLTGFDKQPLAAAKCRIAGQAAKVFVADAQGRIALAFPAGTAVDLEWEPSDTESNPEIPRFYLRQRIVLGAAATTAALTEGNDDCDRRLRNLGFEGTTSSEMTADFQSFFGRPRTGHLDDIRAELIDWHDGGNRPSRAG